MRVTLGNSVTVARQTLTLFVGVRIPIPQPMQNPFSVESGFLFYNVFLWCIVFYSNKYGFEGLISAPSALKIFEIHIVLLQIFALTERKSSPSKLLHI